MSVRLPQTIGSTRSVVPKESKAERPKPTVPGTPSARRPRWTPTSTLSARSCSARPTLFFQRQGRTAAAVSPTPRWSRSAPPRRSWASPATAASCPRRASCSCISPRSCRARPTTSSAAAGWRPSARPSATRPATATAPRTRAGSGAFACTCRPLPTRKDEPGQSPHLAPIRQRIESIFSACKDLFTVERHGARTLAGLRERILQRFLCLAACVSLNHRPGRPSRALVDYCA